MKSILSILVASLLLATQAMAQSRDLDNPTYLQSNVIDGISNPNDEAPVYFTFYAGPGTIKVTGDITSGYGGCILTFHFLDDAYNELSSNDFAGEQYKKKTIKDFSFAKNQRIILKISFNGTATLARFILEGAVHFNNNYPNNQPNNYPNNGGYGNGNQQNNGNNGGSYVENGNLYVAKYISQGVSSMSQKKYLRQLTPQGSRIGIYMMESRTTKTNSGGYNQSTIQLSYYIELPNTTDEKVYGLQDNKFSPKFNEKVWQYVQDKPTLVEKIKSKANDYFYASFSSDDKRLKVWWNIVNDYNRPN